MLDSHTLRSWIHNLTIRMSAGIILAYSNSVAGRLSDITTSQGSGNIGCFFGGTAATLLSGLALIIFSRFGELGREDIALAGSSKR